MRKTRTEAEQGAAEGGKAGSRVEAEAAAPETSAAPQNSEQRQSDATNGAQSEPDGSSSLVQFDFEGQPVRMLYQGGETWFVAADVCSAIGIVNSRDAMARLDDDEKRVALTDTNRGERGAAIVSESGLYTLILRSRQATTPGTLPHRFRRWITHEVIPSIHRTGRYDGGGRKAESGASRRRDATVTLPNWGRFVVINVPGRDVTIRRTEINAAMQEENHHDCTALAGTLKVVAAFWHKVKTKKVNGADPTGGFSESCLEETILRGAELANHYLDVYGRHEFDSPDWSTVTTH